MSDEIRMKLNWSAIVASVIFLTGLIFTSGIVVQNQNHLSDQVGRMLDQQDKIMQKMEAMGERIAILERRNQVIQDSTNPRIQWFKE